jgi:acyl-CoA thioesterase 8
MKVIAQCLAAAQETVPGNMKIHSMHCYFLLAGNSSVPVIYHVERVHSGRSFATRTVQARQKGQCIFTTTCSFVRPPPKSHPEAMIEHSVSLPGDVLMPENCTMDEEQLLKRHKEGEINTSDLERLRRKLEDDPCEWRHLGISDKSPETPPTDKRSRQWVRVKGNIHNQNSHLPALAYFSDRVFLVTAAKVNPPSRGDIGMMVSLDHTIYFHHAADTKADQWMLLELDSSWAGEERALVTQKIWDRNGILVATCYQEGLIRLKKDKTVEPIDATSSKL